MHTTPALGGYGQEDEEFQVIFGYIVSCRPAGDMRTGLKDNIQRKQDSQAAPGTVEKVLRGQRDLRNIEESPCGESLNLQQSEH